MFHFSDDKKFTQNFINALSIYWKKKGENFHFKDSEGAEYYVSLSSSLLGIASVVSTVVASVVGFVIGVVVVRSLSIGICEDV